MGSPVGSGHKGRGRPFDKLRMPPNEAEHTRVGPYFRRRVMVTSSLPPIIVWPTVMPTTSKD
jgi:hypothetical protein